MPLYQFRRNEEVVEILWRSPKDPPPPSPSDLPRGTAAPTQVSTETSLIKPQKLPTPSSWGLEEEPRRVSLALGSSAPVDRGDNTSTCVGCLTTAGGGRRLQSLQHSAQLEESADEYDPDAVSADEDMDANMDEDTIIM